MIIHYIVDINAQGILLLLPKGGKKWCLPGGEQKEGELVSECLERLVREKLHCNIETKEELFTIAPDPVAKGVSPTIHVHRGEIIGIAVGVGVEGVVRAPLDWIFGKSDLTPTYSAPFSSRKRWIRLTEATHQVLIKIYYTRGHFEW